MKKTFLDYKTDKTAEDRARTMVGDGMYPPAYFVTISQAYLEGSQPTKNEPSYFEWEGGTDRITLGEFTTLELAVDTADAVDLNMAEGPRSASIEDRVSGEIWTKIIYKYSNGRTAIETEDRTARINDEETARRLDHTDLEQELKARLESVPINNFADEVGRVYGIMQKDGLDGADADGMSDDELYDSILMFMARGMETDYPMNDTAHEIARGVQARYRDARINDVEDLRKDLDSLVSGS